MRYFLVLGALLAASLQCHAATLLRSGEHADFSRVVIELPRAGDWSLTRSGNSYVVSADALASPVNLDDVFKFIPRKRISSVVYDEERKAIVFILSCRACEVDAFEIKGGHIVVDVRDNDEKVLRKDAPKGALGEKGELSIKSDMKDNRNGPFKSYYFPPFGSISLQGLSLARQVLFNELAKSTAMEELIEKRSDHLEKNTSSIEGAGKSEAGIEGAAKRYQKLISKQVFAGMTSVSKAKGKVSNTEKGIPVKDRASSCAKPGESSLFDIEVKYQDIAQAYAEVFDARDNIRKTELERLVRIQLSLGFFKEALASLRLHPRPDGVAAFLEVVARLLDEQKLTYQQKSALQSCDEYETLWSFLQRGTEETLDIASSSRILLQYLEFPYSLRRIVAPRLVEQLVRADDVHGAYRVAENIREVDKTFSDELAERYLPRPQMAELNIAADAQKHAINYGPNNGAVNGLLRQMRAALEKGEHLTEADWLLVDSSIYQFRSDLRGQELLELKIKLSLAEGNLPAAGGAIQLLLENTSALNELFLDSLRANINIQNSEFITLYLHSILRAWIEENEHSAGREGISSALRKWLRNWGYAYKVDTPEADVRRSKKASPEMDSASMQAPERLALISELLNSDAVH